MILVLIFYLNYPAFNTIVISFIFLSNISLISLIIFSLTLEIKINFDSSKNDLFIKLDIKFSKLFNISFSSKRSIFPLKLFIKTSLII